MTAHFKADDTAAGPLKCWAWPVERINHVLNFRLQAIYDIWLRIIIPILTERQIYDHKGTALLMSSLAGTKKQGFDCSRLYAALAGHIISPNHFATLVVQSSASHDIILSCNR